MPSWKKVLISGSDAALNSLNITAALTASGISYPSSDGTSGQVLITNGLGQLAFSTISSGGTGASVKLIQTIPASTWTFTHNLNEKFPAVTIYNENDEVILPLRIEAQDDNTLIIYFSSLRTGTAAAVVGGSTVSASYALTASYLEGLVDPFPYTGSALITGSLGVTGSVSSTQGFTGSLQGNADTSTTASYALTASYLEGYISPFPFTGSAQITGSLGITGSVNSTGGFTGSLQGNADTSTSASYALNSTSSSYSVSASYALTASYLPNPTVSGSIGLVDKISFTTGSEYVLDAAQIAWDPIDGTFDMGLIGGVTLQVGQEMNIYGKASGAISNGDAVMFAGSEGDHLLMSSATQAVINEHPEYLIGIATQDFDNNDFGYVTVFGKVRGLSTISYPGGTVLYFDSEGSTAGALTDTEPSAPNAKVEMAAVIRSHNTEGILMVRPHVMPKLEDIQDVGITNATEGDLLVRNSDTWRNTKQLSGSYGLTGSLEATSFVGTLTGNASTATTASHALTASSINPLYQNVEVHGNLNVYGTSSFIYVTSSQLDVDNSFISVNVFEPAERFGGIKVYDSGSSTATASLAWDSLHNHWVYENASGSTYSGGMLMAGPRNTGSLGDEPTLTKWMVARSDGGDHLENTQIYSSGSTTQITGSLTVTQGITGSLFGTSSWAVSASNANTASYALTASYLEGYISPFPFTGSAEITGSLGVTGSVEATSFVKAGGTSEQYLRADGSVSTALTSRIEDNFIATAGQTTFPLTYEVGQLEIYYNGSKLYPDEFTATNGTSVVLATGATEGAQISTVKYVAALTTAAVRNETTFITTLNQTTFTVNYTPGQLDVFYNGAKLNVSEFTATNGTSVVLGFECAADESVVIVSYVNQVSGASGTSGYLSKFTGAASLGDSAIFQSGSNVGINTNTPGRLLTIKGTSGQSNQGLEVLSPSGSRLGIIAGRGSNSPEDEKGYFQMTDTGTSRIVLDTSGSSYLNGGNVGLGTSTPSRILEVANSTAPLIKLTSTSNSNTWVGTEHAYTSVYASDNSLAFTGEYRRQIGPSVGWGGFQTFYTDTVERMRITSGGLVGIGTDNPSYKLHNTGDTFSTAYTMNRGGGAWTLIPSSGESALYFRQDAGDSIKMTISGSGNVGIGTTSPQSLTHFYTSTARNIPSLGSAGGHLVIQTGGVIATVMGVNANGNFYIQPQRINDGGTNVYNTLLNPSGGNIGIGTTDPGVKLSILGSGGGFPATSGTSQLGALRLEQDGSNVCTDFGSNGASGAWIQVTNKANLALEFPLLLQPNGSNVLIGTTTDAGNKLDVNGVVKSNGVKFENGSGTLNYYEEGTFTPTAVATNFSPATPLSGKYVRIGNQVTVTCTWSVAPGGTGKRYIVFNLPFAFVTGASFTGIVSNYDSGLSSYSSNVGTSVRNSSSSATQQYLEAVFTSNTVTNIHFLITYFTF